MLGGELAILSPFGTFEHSTFHPTQKMALVAGVKPIRYRAQARDVPGGYSIRYTPRFHSAGAAASGEMADRRGTGISSRLTGRGEAGGCVELRDGKYSFDSKTLIRKSSGTKTIRISQLPY